MSNDTDQLLRYCPVCGDRVTDIDVTTEVLEEYDDGVGQPNDTRRIPKGPARRMVPGAMTARYGPCGHEVPGAP